MNGKIKRGMGAFLLAGGLLGGTAAHAASIPVIDGSNINSTDNPLLTASAGRSVATTALYELDLASTSQVTIGLLDTILDGKPVSYALYYDTDSTSGQGTIGGQIAQTTSPLVTVSNVLDPFYSGVMGAGQYILKIVFNTDPAAYASAVATFVGVSPVPLPGAALLFGSALLGAGALRRRRKASIAAA